MRTRYREKEISFFKHCGKGRSYNFVLPDFDRTRTPTPAARGWQQSSTLWSPSRTMTWEHGYEGVTSPSRTQGETHHDMMDVASSCHLRIVLRKHECVWKRKKKKIGMMSSYHNSPWWLAPLFVAFTLIFNPGFVPVVSEARQWSCVSFFLQITIYCFENIIRRLCFI